MTDPIIPRRPDAECRQELRKAAEAHLTVTVNGRGSPMMLAPETVIGLLDAMELAESRLPNRIRRTLVAALKDSIAVNGSAANGRKTAMRWLEGQAVAAPKAQKD